MWNDNLDSSLFFIIFLVHQIFLTFDLHKEICLFFSLRRRTLPWYDLSFLMDLQRKKPTFVGETANENEKCISWIDRGHKVY